jgi:aryl-alcohol dehydrogenase-like predicted oxidoreductase
MPERTISVPGIGFKIPAVGFGCSSLTGTGRKNALLLLETAFDAGVRHFDVARYYGYGDAEKILGEFLKSRRDQVTITSKFGLDPPKRAGTLRIAIGAARRLVKLLPAARKVMQKQAQGFVQRGKFSAADARASLETSLRELGTDYIDFFLLHEYSAEDNSSDELMTFLEDSVKSGKIRYFGLGTSIDSVLRTLEARPALCNVVQFENSVIVRNIDKLPASSPVKLVITFGGLAESFRSISTFLKAHPEIVKNWSAALGADCSNEEVVSALMLNYAVDANPRGLVLFSSRNVARVTKNINSVLRPEFSAAQVSLFGQLVQRDGVSRPVDSQQLRVES